MSKSEIIGWLGVLLNALGENPIAALAIGVALIALLVTYTVVSKAK